MTRALEYLRHHVIAITALVLSILALASASYAALTIDGRDIRNHTIDPVKLDPKFISGSVRAWAVVTASGRLIAGAGHPRVSTVGLPGQYEIDWGVGVGRHCATQATVDIVGSTADETVSGDSFVAGYVSAATYAHRKVRRSVIETFNPSGQPTPLGFDVTVVC